MTTLRLTATAAVVVSGGSSEAVKAASGLLRVAKGMGRVSARLVDEVVELSARAIDLRLLARGRLREAVRLEELAPLVRTAERLDDLRGATDVGTVLHLLPLVDGAEDAGRLARVGKAMGRETAATAEILGKTRLLRATLRWSARLTELVGGLLALVASLGSAISHAAWSLTLRRTRRALR